MKISGFWISGLGVRVWGTSSDRHKGARLGITLGFAKKMKVLYIFMKDFTLKVPQLSSGKS